jgi:hypothetical protein
VALAPLALIALAAAASSPVLARYDVRAADGARELRVNVSFSEPPRGGLRFEEGMGRFARDVEVAKGPSWSAAVVDGDVLRAPACARACGVRYRFALAEAAGGGRDRTSAFAQQGALVAPPSTWLVRPVDRGPGRYRLAVDLPAGLAFATGLARSADGAAYEAEISDLPEAPYSAFGPFEVTAIAVPGGAVDVAVLPGDLPVGRPAIREWVEDAARDVAGYYGRFPLPRATVMVVPGGRRAVGYGTTMGNGGASVLIWVGAQAREEDLRRDWVLTHELSHLTLPNVPRAQRWLEEGLATYVEPIARARRGRLSAEEVWGDLVRRTPQGLPGAGGLDANRGFQAIYWGGDLLWVV